MNGIAFQLGDTLVFFNDGCSFAVVSHRQQRKRALSDFFVGVGFEGLSVGGGDFGRTDHSVLDGLQQMLDPCVTS